MFGNISNQNLVYVLGKKRLLPSSEADQPLDLSSGQANDQQHTSKRARLGDETLEQCNNIDLINLAAKLSKSFQGNGEILNEETIAKRMLFQQQQESKPMMNGLLEKLAFLQAMSGGNNMTPSLPMPPTPAASGPSFINMDGSANPSLASISAHLRDNPAFAQYFSMAMAALSNSQASASVAATELPSTASAPSNSSGQSSSQVNIVVKQGNSRCAECNIVFYKHENYLVHKELYCASRRTTSSTSESCTGEAVSPKSNITIEPATSPVGAPQATSSLNRPTSNASAHTAPSPSACSIASASLLMSQKFGSMSATVAGGELVSPKMKQELTLPTSPGLPPCSMSPAASSAGSIISPNGNAAAAVTNTSGSKSTIFQYYCAACGIKFTSYNNLQAHQTYYCLKRTPPGGNSQGNSLLPPTTGSVSPSPLMPTNPTAMAAMASLLSPELLAKVAASFSSSTRNGKAEGDASMGLSDMIDLTNPQSWALMAAATAAAAQSNSASSKPLLCLKCKGNFMSPEMLAAHICPVNAQQMAMRMMENNGKMEGNHKPNQPANTTTASSLQTYKCTICGYKGHTMRGMRTHVRVHSEELSASGAYEEDFIVANTDLPEQSSTRRSVNHGGGLGATNHQRNRRRSSAANVESNHVNTFLGSNAAAIAATLLNEIEKQQQQQQQKTLNGDLTPSISITPVNEAQLSPSKLSTSSTGGISPNDAFGSTQTHNCQFCRYNSNYKGN